MNLKYDYYTPNEWYDYGLLTTEYNNTEQYQYGKENIQNENYVRLNIEGYDDSTSRDKDDYGKFTEKYD